MDFSAILLTFCALYSALIPTNSQQFFITPDTPAVLTFDGSEKAVEFTLFDVNGTEIKKLPATFDGKKLTLTVNLPSGYYELQNSASDQVFGLVSQTAYCADPQQDLQAIVDPFFAIDGAMTGLVRLPEKRGQMAEIARRSGIGMIRERLGWNHVHRSPGFENLDLEGAKACNDCRNAIATAGVKVLELNHDAPAWMPRTGEKYPQDLLMMRRVWDAFTAHWNRQWGGLEVWNEPEIGFGSFLPPDQYMPVWQTVAYQHQVSKDEAAKEAETGERTPLVSCVMSGCSRIWLDPAAEMGVLDTCDVFSFHTYARASQVEGIYGDYQDWLRQYGHPTMPMWLTECGRPWKIGPGRPPQSEDLTSAIDIAMKGVEARAFGIQKYFPFVFPYYEERESNFGMMSRDYTPLRSIAGYAQLVRTLAFRDYVGDLPVPEGWLRARVFSPVGKIPEGLDARIFTLKDALVAVLYAPEDPKNPTQNKKRTLKLPVTILRAERCTGEVIPVAANGKELESVDGFVYVWLRAEEVQKLNLIKTDGVMYALHQERQASRHIQVSESKKPVSPIALRYCFDENEVRWTVAGYDLLNDPKEGVQLEIEATNHSAQALTIPVFCRGRFDGTKVTGPEKITVPANGRTRFTVSVTTNPDYLKKGMFCPVEIEAGAKLVLNLKFNFKMEDLCASKARVRKMDLKDHSRWVKSAGACKEQKFAMSGETFTEMVWFGEGDHWSYPRYQLPEDFNGGDYDGVLIRGRCWDPTNQSTVRLFMYTTNGAFMTSQGIFPTDGEWHCAQIPFNLFTRFGTGKGFDPKAINRFSIGGNTKLEFFQIEVSEMYFYKD